MTHVYSANLFVRVEGRKPRDIDKLMDRLAELVRIELDEELAQESPAVVGISIDWNTLVYHAKEKS